VSNLDPVRVNPALAAAARRSPIARTTLAELTGFHHVSNFCKALDANRIVVTPLLEGRLKALARLLDFDGAIFADADDEAAR
jgi:hypothetical protein